MTVRKSALAVAAMIALALAIAADTISRTSNTGISASAGPSGPSIALPTGVSESGSGALTLSERFVTATSSKSFSATVAALKHAVTGNHMTVVDSFGQSSALSCTGPRLAPAQTFLVSNPTTNNVLLQTDPVAGAVLPVRIYVWQNGVGKIEVGYFDPGPLLAALDPTFSHDAKKMSTTVNGIAEAATGAVSTSARAIATRFLVATSPRSLPATVDALKHSVSGNGMTVVGNVDQASALSATGSRPTGAQTVFIDNPTMSPRSLQADPVAGAVLPVGIYLWQNSAGNTLIDYVDPGPLLTRLNRKLAAGGQKISMSMSEIVQGAL